MSSFTFYSTAKKISNNYPFFSSFKVIPYLTIPQYQSLSIDQLLVMVMIVVKAKKTSLLSYDFTWSPII